MYQPAWHRPRERQYSVEKRLEEMRTYPPNPPP